jgi:hypothetical protein
MEASTAVAAVAIAMGTLAAGCSASSHRPQAALRPTTTRPLTTFVSAPTESSAAAAGVVATSSTSAAIQTSTVPPCLGRATAISVSPVEEAMGNVAVILVFRNIGTTTCSLYGYPGVAGLDRSGRQTTQAQRTQTGFFAIVPVPYRAVTLVPSAVASAVVNGADNQPTASPCPVYPAFLVTPPGTYTSTKVPINTPHLTANGFPGCDGLSVQPVVAGTKGGEP